MKTVLISSFLMGVAVTASAQTLTFGTEPSYPPFESTTEKGELVGFDIDIVNAICNEIQAVCTFQTQPFDALIPSVKAKRFDAPISAIDITSACQTSVV